MGCGLDGNFLDYKNLRASGTVFFASFCGILRELLEY